MEWRDISTRQNDAKAYVQRENTAQTAVGIGTTHDNRNARKRNTNVSVRRIRILSNRIETSSSRNGMIVIVITRQRPACIHFPRTATREQANRTVLRGTTVWQAFGILVPQAPTVIRKGSTVPAATATVRRVTSVPRGARWQHKKTAAARTCTVQKGRVHPLQSVRDTTRAH